MTRNFLLQKHLGDNAVSGGRPPTKLEYSEYTDNKDCVLIKCCFLLGAHRIPVVVGGRGERGQMCGGGSCLQCCPQTTVLWE